MHRPRIAALLAVALAAASPLLPAEESAALQKQHLAHLTAMGESGKMVVAGPFSDQADPAYRGACIYRVGSIAEARALAEQDPIVKAGQLRVEVMTWWYGKGYMTFPKAGEKLPERKAAP